MGFIGENVIAWAGPQGFSHKKLEEIQRTKNVYLQKGREPGSTVVVVGDELPLEVLISILSLALQVENQGLVRSFQLFGLVRSRIRRRQRQVGMEGDDVRNHRRRLPHDGGTVDALKSCIHVISANMAGGRRLVGNLLSAFPGEADVLLSTTSQTDPSRPHVTWNSGVDGLIRDL